MKRLNFITILLFCSAILVVGAQDGFAWPTYRDGCITCHGTGFAALNNHTIHTGVPCSSCHPGGVPGQNVLPSNCIVCHPAADPGLCPLIDVPTHAGIKNACVACHTECAPVTTTTTVAPTTTTTAIEPTTTTVEPASTTTSVPPTTTTIPAQPTVDLGTATGNPCAQVSLPITLTNDGITPIAGVSMDIGYNSTYLTPVNATIGPAGQQAGKNVSTNIVSPGLYRIGVFSSSNLSPIGNGIVAYVTFEISCDAPDASYQLANTPSTATPEGVDVPTDGSVGCIQVCNGCTTTTTTIEPTTTTSVSTTTTTIEPTTTTSVSTTTSTSVQPTTTTTSVRPATTTTSPATTTVPSNSHISICLSCHFVSDLHAEAAHSNCTICHTGTPGKGNVEAGKCAGCHPTGNPGKCNLANANYHGGSCLTCHAECSKSSTTTTVKGPSTTTSTPISKHIDDCLSCHFASDLHAKTAHSNCTICHTGTPGKGNVEAGKCAGCHPKGNPGKCNLVSYHGSPCITCHTECSKSSTTTTVTGTSTTTSTPASQHINDCLTCHFVSDLHAKAAHSNCAICHTGTPGKGNVEAGTCAGCHPTGDPGKCSLVNSHGGSCLTCHVDCTDGISTTTTTTTPAPSDTLTVSPGSVRIPWFFPRPFVKLMISGTNVKFVDPINVEIEGAPPVRMIEHVSSTVIIVRAWIPPKFLIGKGAKRVTVQSKDQLYVGKLEIK